mgnify:CR=1 FL=1
MIWRNCVRETIRGLCLYAWLLCNVKQRVVYIDENGCLREYYI